MEVSLILPRYERTTRNSETGNLSIEWSFYVSVLVYTVYKSSRQERPYYYKVIGAARLESMTHIHTSILRLSGSIELLL